MGTPVGGVDLYYLAEGVLGIRELLGSDVRQGKVIPHPRVVRLLPDCGAEMGNGVLEELLRQIDVTEVVVDLQGVRLDAMCREEEVQRAVVHPLLVEKPAELHHGFHVTIVPVDGGAECVDRLVGLPLRVAQLPEHVVVLGSARVETDRCLRILEPRLDVADRMLHHRHIVVMHSGVGRKADGLAVGLPCRLELLLAVAGGTELRVEARPRGVDGNGGLKRRGGLLEITSTQENVTDLVMGERIFVVHLGGIPKRLERTRPVPELEVRGAEVVVGVAVVRVHIHHRLVG